MRCVVKVQRLDLAPFICVTLVVGPFRTLVVVFTFPFAETVRVAVTLPFLVFVENDVPFGPR